MRYMYILELVCNFLETMNTLEFIRDFRSIKNLQKDEAFLPRLRKTLYKANIHWVDSASGNFQEGQPIRIILTDNTKPYEKINKLNIQSLPNRLNKLLIHVKKECSGLVLLYDPTSNVEWSILVLPLPTPRMIYNKQLNDGTLPKQLFLDYYRGNYEVTPIIDGTILHLYWFDGKWRLSSTRGYDVGDLRFVGNLTFMQALIDRSDIEHDELNKNWVYSISLRVFDFHKFDQHSRGGDLNDSAILIRILDRASLSRISLEDNAPSGIRIVDKLSHEVSLTEYGLAAISADDKSIPYYGIVLNAKTFDIPEEYSTLMLKSKLYNEIEQELYSRNSFD